MYTSKPEFLNFKVDHMTMLVAPDFYNVAYALFRIVLGVTPHDILYNKTKEWIKGEGERSMTFASVIGDAPDEPKEVDKTIIAVVQPTEPKSQRSHVREMLNEHRASAHWQHIALRTPDLLRFHQHAIERGVNFITPILKDDGDDLIQVFTGEWFVPSMPASALFFEFVQRNPSAELLNKLENRNRESWFIDKTFLGLYEEKEKEYQSGKVKPFIDPELFEELKEFLGNKEIYKIDDEVLAQAEKIMLNYAKRSKGSVSSAERAS